MGKDSRADIAINWANLNFGRNDAENDQDLMNYFYESGKAHEILKNGKYLVIGRKGAGKTALLKRVASEESVQTVKAELGKYKFSLHQKLEEIGVPKNKAYEQSWKLFFYLAAYTKHVDHNAKHSSRKINKIISNTLKSGNGDSVREIFKWIGKIGFKAAVETIGVPIEIAVNATGNSAQQNKLGTETTSLIEMLEAYFNEEVQKENDIPVVLLDRLDEFMNDDDEKFALNLITSCVCAAREINLNLRESNPRAEHPLAVVFLRTDIWDRLKFNDKNKLKQDTIDLEWDEGQLFDLIARRIEATGVDSNDGVHHHATDDLWYSVFENEELQHRSKPKNYLMHRSFGRPRDLIVFAGYILEQHKQRVGEDNVSGNQRLMNRDDIYEGEKGYSRHLVNELDDEFGPYYKDWKKVWQIVREVGTRNFKWEDWFKKAEKLLGTTKDDQQLAEKYLDDLFKASAVGVFSKGGNARTGRKSGSQTVYFYQDPYTRPDRDRTLQFNPGLMKGLGIKDK